MSARRRLPEPAVEVLGLLAVLIGLILAFSLFTERFLTLTTLRTIANQVPENVIAAVGLTFVLLIAGIDLLELAAIKPGDDILQNRCAGFAS